MQGVRHKKKKDKMENKQNGFRKKKRNHQSLKAVGSELRRSTASLSADMGEPLFWREETTVLDRDSSSSLCPQ